jgi:WD40 repeat protein
MELPPSAVVDLAKFNDAYEKIRFSCAVHMARYSESESNLYAESNKHDDKATRLRAAKRSGSDLKGKNPSRTVVKQLSTALVDFNTSDDAALVSTVEPSLYPASPYERMNYESLQALRRQASRETINELAFGRSHRSSFFTPGTHVRFAIATLADEMQQNHSTAVPGHKVVSTIELDDELARFAEMHDVNDEIQFLTEPSKLVQAKYFLAQQGTMPIRSSVFVYVLSRVLWRMKTVSADVSRVSRLGAAEGAELLASCRRTAQRIFDDMDNDAVGVATWGDFTNCLLMLSDRLAHHAATAEVEHNLAMTLVALSRNKTAAGGGKGAAGRPSTPSSAADATEDVDVHGAYCPRALPDVAIPGGGPVRLTGGQVILVENSRFVIFESADRYYVCQLDEPSSARYFFTRESSCRHGDGGPQDIDPAIGGGPSSMMESTLLAAFLCRFNAGIQTCLVVVNSKFQFRLFDLPTSSSLKPLIERGRFPPTFSASITASCCLFSLQPVAETTTVVARAALMRSSAEGGLHEDTQRCLLGDRLGVVRVISIDAIVDCIRQEDMQQVLSGHHSVSGATSRQSARIITAATLVQKQMHRTGMPVCTVGHYAASQGITAGHDGFVHIFDIATLNKIHSFRAHDAGVRSMAFSAGLQIIVTQGFDRGTTVWSGTRGASKFELHDGGRPHMHNIIRVFIVESLRQVVTCDASGLCKVWDVATSTCHSNFTVGHDNDVIPSSRASDRDAAGTIGPSAGGGGGGSEPSEGGSGDAAPTVDLSAGKRGINDGILRVHMDICSTVRYIVLDNHRRCFFASGFKFRVCAPFVPESSLQKAHTESLRAVVAACGVGLMFTAVPTELRVWETHSGSHVRTITVDTAPEKPTLAAPRPSHGQTTNRSAALSGPGDQHSGEVLIRCMCSDSLQSKIFAGRSDGSVLVFRTGGDREVKRFISKAVFIPGSPHAGSLLDVVGIGYLDPPRREIVTVSLDGVLRFFPDVGPQRVIVRYLFFDDFAKLGSSFALSPHPPSSRKSIFTTSNMSGRKLSQALSGRVKKRNTVANIFAQVLGESFMEKDQNLEPGSPSPPASPLSPKSSSTSADHVRLTAFSPVLNLIVCAYSSGRIVVTDSQSTTGFPLHVFEVVGDPSALCFLGSYPCLVVGDASGRIHFYLLHGSIMLEVYDKFLKQYSPSHLVNSSLQCSPEAVCVVDVSMLSSVAGAPPPSLSQGTSICVMLYDCVTGALLISVSDGTVRSLAIDDLVIALNLRPVKARGGKVLQQQALAAATLPTAMSKEVIVGSSPSALLASDAEVEGSAEEKDAALLDAVAVLTGKSRKDCEGLDTDFTSLLGESDANSLSGSKLSLQEILLAGGLINFTRRASVTALSPQSALSKRLSHAEILAVRQQIEMHREDRRSSFMRPGRRFTFLEIRDTHERGRHGTALAAPPESHQGISPSRHRASKTDADDLVDGTAFGEREGINKEDAFLGIAEKEFVETARRAQQTPVYSTVRRWVRLIFCRSANLSPAATRELLLPSATAAEAEARWREYRASKASPSSPDANSSNLPPTASSFSLVTQIATLRNGYPVTSDVDGAVFVWKPLFHLKLAAVSISSSIPRALGQLGRTLKDSFKRAAAAYEREQQLQEAVQQFSSVSRSMAASMMPAIPMPAHCEFMATDKELAEEKFDAAELFKVIDVGINRLLRELGNSVACPSSSPSSRAHSSLTPSASTTSESDGGLMHSSEIQTVEYFEQAHDALVKRFAAHQQMTSDPSRAKNVEMPPAAATGMGRRHTVEGKGGRRGESVVDIKTDPAEWSGLFEHPAGEHELAPQPQGNLVVDVDSAIDNDSRAALTASATKITDPEPSAFASSSEGGRAREAPHSSLNFSGVYTCMSTVFEDTAASPTFASPTDKGASDGNAAPPTFEQAFEGRLGTDSVAAVPKPRLPIQPSPPMMALGASFAVGPHFQYVAPKNVIPKFHMPPTVGLAELYREVMHPESPHRATGAARETSSARQEERNSPEKTPNCALPPQAQDGASASPRNRRVSSSPNRYVAEAVRRAPLPEPSEDDQVNYIQEKARHVIATRQLAFHSSCATIRGNGEQPLTTINRQPPDPQRPATGPSNSKPAPGLQSLSQFLSTVSSSVPLPRASLVPTDSSSSSPRSAAIRQQNLHRMPSTARAACGAQRSGRVPETWGGASSSSEAVSVVVVAPTTAISLPFGLVLPSGAVIKAKVGSARGS